tara:strand:- start:21133 stop:21654 length:522 start_codon:yes stop_codon:yes gene_type:complete
VAAANSTSIRKVRSEADIAAVKALVWEFFDVIRDRYPDMLDTIDRYIAEQDVEGQLANFARVFLPPAGECLVADHDGEQVGMIMLKPLPDKACEMNRMYVRDTARGLGLGRALCESLIAEARNLGFREVLLDALYRHVEALALYESVGFETYRPQVGFDADDERVIHMRLTLH